MGTPSMTIAGDADSAVVPGAPTPTPYKNPFLWVPSSYLAMGLIYVTVGSVAACAEPVASVAPLSTARQRAAIAAASNRFGDARGLQRYDIRSDPFD